MSLEQNVQELTAAIRDLIDATAGGTTEKAVEEKKAPTKKAPAKRGAKKAPAGPTIAEVRDLLRKVSKDVSRKEAQALLAEYDCKKVTDLTEEDYADFIKDCELVLGGEEEGEEEGDDDI